MAPKTRKGKKQTKRSRKDKSQTDEPANDDDIFGPVEQYLPRTATSKAEMQRLRLADKRMTANLDELGNTLRSFGTLQANLNDMKKQIQNVQQIAAQAMDSHTHQESKFPISMNIPSTGTTNTESTAPQNPLLAAIQSGKKGDSKSIPTSEIRRTSAALVKHNVAEVPESSLAMGTPTEWEVEGKTIKMDPIRAFHLTPTSSHYAAIKKSLSELEARCGPARPLVLSLIRDSYKNQWILTWINLAAKQLWSIYPLDFLSDIYKLQDWLPNDTIVCLCDRTAISVGNMMNLYSLRNVSNALFFANLATIHSTEQDQEQVLDRYIQHFHAIACGFIQLIQSPPRIGVAKHSISMSNTPLSHLEQSLLEYSKAHAKPQQTDDELIACALSTMIVPIPMDDCVRDYLFATLTRLRTLGLIGSEGNVNDNNKKIVSLC